MITDDEYQLLGLTSLQGNVLTTLLELGGEATAPDIIKKLSEKQKVNRTSIYSVLNKLEQMTLLIIKNETPAKYTLVTTSPKKLMEKVMEPQKVVQEEFTRELEKAKASQPRKLEYELYYLKNKEQILNQLELVIEQATDYLLIMATSTMLMEIEQLIYSKVNNSDITILILPTWSPDPDIDFQKIINYYRRKLGSNQVSQPLPIFQRILPMMQSFITEFPLELQQLSAKSYFIQALSMEEMIMATYIDSQASFGSGFYSREPTISQMMHIIYLSLFEELQEISSQICDTILKKKLGHAFNQLNNFLTN